MGNGLESISTLISIILMSGKCTINSDGTIGSWLLTSSLPEPRAGHSSVISDDYVYVIGGYHNNDYFNSVLFAKVNTDGTISCMDTNDSATSKFNSIILQ